jgi:sugar transferase (PEP-CTERM system associated)
MRSKFLGRYWQLPILVMRMAEALAIFGAFRLVCAVRRDPVVDADTCSIQALVFCGCVLATMVGMGLFSRRARDRMAGVVLRIALSVGVGAMLAGALLVFLPDYRIGLTSLAASVVVACILLMFTRTCAVAVTDQDVFKRRVLALGTGANAAHLLRLRRRNDQRGFKVVGFLPLQSEARTVPDERLLVTTMSLSKIASSQEIDEIVVAMDDRRRQFPLTELLECRLAGIEVTELSTFLERETGKIHLDILTPSWMIFGPGFRHDLLRRWSERGFDLVVSLALLMVTWPLMVLTVLAIKLEDGLDAPVLYRQERVGYAGRVFEVFKFRSMQVDAEKDGKARWAEADDPRVTGVGAFIRKTRIDELPQLLNVLKGRMSFVGPRPERPEFVAHLAKSIPYYHERHTVKPGITGWAQLCYPYGASEQDAIEKLQYDLYYVKHHRLFFDILILLQTAEVILFGKGAR